MLKTPPTLKSMSDSIQHILARRVHELRTASDLSKVEFCLQVGISRPQLDRIEEGNANLKLISLEQIARKLGVEPWELIK